MKGSVRLPTYIIKNLKRGLKLHNQGLSGPGLTSETVRLARAGVTKGRWSRQKVRKARNWFRRHSFSRKRMRTPSAWDRPPRYSPLFVAWLLWGGNGDGRAQAFMERNS